MAFCNLPELPFSHSQILALSLTTQHKSLRYAKTESGKKEAPWEREWFQRRQQRLAERVKEEEEEEDERRQVQRHQQQAHSSRSKRERQQREREEERLVQLLQKRNGQLLRYQQQQRQREQHQHPEHEREGHDEVKGSVEGQYGEQRRQRQRKSEQKEALLYAMGAYDGAGDEEEEEVEEEGEVEEEEEKDVEADEEERQHTTTTATTPTVATRAQRWGSSSLSDDAPYTPPVKRSTSSPLVRSKTIGKYTQQVQERHVAVCTGRAWPDRALTEFGSVLLLRIVFPAQGNDHLHAGENQDRHLFYWDEERSLLWYSSFLTLDARAYRLSLLLNKSPRHRFMFGCAGWACLTGTLVAQPRTSSVANSFPTSIRTLSPLSGSTFL
jgi:hypothetical protein